MKSTSCVHVVHKNSKIIMNMLDKLCLVMTYSYMYSVKKNIILICPPQKKEV